MPVSVRFSCPWCTWALDVPAGSTSYPAGTIIQLDLGDYPDAIDRKLSYHVVTVHPEKLEDLR